MSYMNENAYYKMKINKENSEGVNQFLDNIVLKN